MLLHEFSDRLSELFTAGLLASVGGAAQSLYSHVRGDKPLSISLFLINVALAFFVGNVVGGLLPKAYEYRDSILLVSGFSMYPILNMFNVYVEKYLKNKIIPNIEAENKDK